MALTSNQFYFLVREKVIHRDTLIEVKRKYNINVSENYKFNKEEIVEAGLSSIYANDEHTEFAIGYYMLDNREKIYHTSIKNIVSIEGQDVDRYYKALEELMANKNANTIESPTDVINSVIGQKRPKLLGIELYDGMKIILKNDKTPKYNNRVLNVRGYGSKVRLVCNAGRPRTKPIVNRPKQKRGRKVGYRKCETKLVAKQD